MIICDILITQRKGVNGMKSWIEGFQESIDFIEQSLTGEPDIRAAADKAALSPFYYQRIFGALCGMTVNISVRAE